MSDYDMCTHQIRNFSEIISQIIIYKEVVSRCIIIAVRIIPYKAVVVSVIKICFGSLIYFPAVRADHIVLDRRHFSAFRSQNLNL